MNEEMILSEEMEENEENTELEEYSEDESSGGGYLALAAAAAGCVVVGGLAHKYVVQPLWGKAKDLIARHRAKKSKDSVVVIPKEDVSEVDDTDEEE